MKELRPFACISLFLATDNSLLTLDQLIYEIYHHRGHLLLNHLTMTSAMSLPLGLKLASTRLTSFSRQSYLGIYRDYPMQKWQCFNTCGTSVKPQVRYKLELSQQVYPSLLEYIHHGNIKPLQYFFRGCSSRYPNILDSDLDLTSVMGSFTHGRVHQWRFLCTYILCTYPLVLKSHRIKLLEGEQKKLARRVFNWSKCRQRNIKVGERIARDLHYLWSTRS